MCQRAKFSHLFGAVFLGLALSLPMMEANAAEPQIPEKLVSSEQGLSHHIANLLTGPWNKKRYRARAKTERALLKVMSDYYIENDYRPLWVTTGGIKDKTASLFSVLEKSDHYGLQLTLEKQLAEKANTISLSLEDLAKFEIEMSKAAYAYAKSAKVGHFIPNQLSRALDYNIIPPNVIDVLTELAASQNVEKTLMAYHPTHPQFWKLQSKLKEFKQAQEEHKKLVQIPNGPLIKPNTRHEQISLLRERLDMQVPMKNGQPLYPEDIYDSALMRVVKTFQAENGLRANGIIDRRTRQRLNKGKVDRSRQIIANMERWRWLPESLGGSHIHVNIPEFLVRVNMDKRLVLTERIVVGKRHQKTPAFSDEMEKVVFNPYWNVPQSIIWNEMGGSTPRGYEGRVVGGKLYVRQPPGPRNALGQIKFLFPNKHAVYLHDTPSKSLFNQKVRAFSHGCMRLRNPLKMADVVLAANGYTPQSIKKEIARGKNQHIPLNKKIPVHVTYFTARVDDDNHMHFYNDLYGHDERVLAAFDGRPMRLEPKQSIRVGSLRRKQKPKPKKQVNFFSLLFNN